MSTFLCSLREQHTIVSDDTNGIPVQVTETRDQSLTVKFFKLLEAGSVEYTPQNLMNIKRLLVIARNDTVKFISGEKGGLRLTAVVPIVCQVVSHPEV
jgi:hypothetical protein